mmetsp:Transcript_15416/g.62048  ORF Transcript_15416/g.62048 Transcript_15416/m.62048 type:complete len:308 (+) Transcript_15416:310-1233(+)
MVFPSTGTAPLGTMAATIIMTRRSGVFFNDGGSRGSRCLSLAWPSRRSWRPRSSAPSSEGTDHHGRLEAARRSLHNHPTSRRPPTRSRRRGGHSATTSSSSAAARRARSSRRAPPPRSSRTAWRSSKPATDRSAYLGAPSGSFATAPSSTSRSRGPTWRDSKSSSGTCRRASSRSRWAAAASTTPCSTCAPYPKTSPRGTRRRGRGRRCGGNTSLSRTGRATPTAPSTRAGRRPRSRRSPRGTRSAAPSRRAGASTAICSRASSSRPSSSRAVEDTTTTTRPPRAAAARACPRACRGPGAWSPGTRA